MDKWFRYANLLKQGGFGASLPRGALLNYAALHLGKIHETVGENGGSFPVVSVFATRRCNLKCSFCICGRVPEDWREYELTRAKMHKILRLGSVKNSLILVFTGGEPTVNDDLPSLMRMSRLQGHLVGMISNGTRLGEVGADLVRAGLCDTQVSIYDNTYEKLADILPGFTRISPVNASYVLLRSKLYQEYERDFSGLLDIVRMCRETGCSSLKFNICQRREDGSNLDEQIYAGDEVYDAFVQKCKDSLPKVHFSGYNCKFMLPSPGFSLFFPAPVAPPAQLENVPRQCRQPWTMASFDGKGCYGLCCGTEIQGERNNVFLYGQEVINGEKPRRIRRSLLHPEEPLALECRNCVYLGGSFASDL